MLADAYAGEVPVEVVFALDSDSSTRDLVEEHGTELLLTDERGLKKVAGTDTPRGPVAVIRVPLDSKPTSSSILVSCGVSDPGNVGTLIRTARAFGWGFAYTEGTADPWSPKVLRAGAGAQFGTPVSSLEDLTELSALGYEAVATVPSGGVDPSRLEVARPAVLVGEEASGLDTETIDAANHVVTVPMPGGTESLNAAVAAGIVLYALTPPTGSVGEAGGQV